MWAQLKSNHPSVIMKLEFEEFASIEVEKTLKGVIPQYVVNVDIYDIGSDSCVLFELKDIEKALKIIKKEIEELYNEIPLFDDSDIESWFDNFQDLMSGF